MVKKNFMRPIKSRIGDTPSSQKKFRCCAPQEVKVVFPTMHQQGWIRIVHPFHFAINILTVSSLHNVHCIFIYMHVLQNTVYYKSVVVEFCLLCIQIICTLIWVVDVFWWMFSYHCKCSTCTFTQTEGTL